jgi:GntR family transcriptional regulator
VQQCTGAPPATSLVFRPIYHQVADRLRDRIESGGLPDGVLPSAVQLAGEFGVGRDAVRDALAVLVHEGLIEKRRTAPRRCDGACQRPS